MRWRSFLFSSKTGSKMVSSKLAVAVVEFQGGRNGPGLTAYRIFPTLPEGPRLR